MIRKRIYHKQVYIFDWDGTLFDSMAIKTDNFCEVLSMQLQSRSNATIDDIRKLFKALSGIPRYEIFHRIAGHFGVSLTQDAIDIMSGKLTTLNTTRLAQANLFPDALPFLQTIADAHRTLYISSSVPEEELHRIVADTLPPALLSRFSGLFGSAANFTKGKGHIGRILAETGLTAEDCIVFGDDKADVELSRQAGVDCVRLERSGRPGTAEIASFGEVLLWLK
jgi:phosphoglycolate phosphatase